MQICRFPTFKGGWYNKYIQGLPDGGVILCVKMVDREPCLFVECNPTAALKNRVIEVFLDNQDIPCDMGVERKYIGSAVDQDHLCPAPAYHYYERLN